MLRSLQELLLTGQTQLTAKIVDLEYIVENVWSEEDHPRDENGRFGSGAPGYSKAETRDVPKRGGGAGAQLRPDVVQRLKDLGVSKLPAAHIKNVEVMSDLDSGRVHQGALIKWRDDKGREQRGYSAEFDKQNAAKKWERVLAGRPKVEAQLGRLRSKVEESPAHAAAMLIALTGLRPGGAASLSSTGHYGATTMEARHLSFSDGKAHINYIGKAGKENKATVTDPKLVRALKSLTEGKQPSERVFPGVTSDSVAAVLPKGVKTKDLRTIVATSTAERLLDEKPPTLTGDKKADARHIISILKSVSTDVSKQLNNTPAMARRSYIAPQVIQAWGKKHGIRKEWLE
jgi:DNA topoisomerase-1